MQGGFESKYIGNDPACEKLDAVPPCLEPAGE